MFGYTKLFRNRLCLVGFLMALCALLNNREHYLRNPGTGLWTSYIVNCFMRQYLFLDLVEIIYQGFINKTIIRKDLVFHHLFCLIPFHISLDTFTMTFVTINEVLSIGPLLFTNRQYQAMFRMLVIVLIRFPVWLQVFFTQSLLYNTYEDVTISHQYFATFTPLVMLYLDYCWFMKAKLIYSIQKND